MVSKPRIVLTINEIHDLMREEPTHKKTSMIRTINRLRQRSNDVGNTDVRPEPKAKDSKNDDANVLPEDPVIAAQIPVPEGNDLDDRWKDQCESGTAHCAHEGDHCSQIGNHGCQSN